jgi:Peptidase family M13
MGITRGLGTLSPACLTRLVSRRSEVRLLRPRLPSVAKAVSGCLSNQHGQHPPDVEILDSQYRDESMRVQLNTNPHSPGHWRAIGPPSNLPEFYDAFGCAEGSPMRRAEAERPSIW